MAAQKTEQDLIGKLEAVSGGHYKCLDMGLKQYYNFGCYICESTDAKGAPIDFQFTKKDYPRCVICSECAQAYPSGAIAKIVPMHAFAWRGQPLAINNAAWEVYYGDVSSHIIELHYTGDTIYATFPGAQGLSTIHAPLDQLTGPGVRLVRTWLESNPFWPPESK